MPPDGGQQQTKQDKPRKKSRKQEKTPSKVSPRPELVQGVLFHPLYASLPLDEEEWLARRFPSCPASSKPFLYWINQVFTPSREPEDVFYRSLKSKSAKVKAWWEERGKVYAEQGCRFLALTLTFKDEKAFEEFEAWGGRRQFMKMWKKQNKGKIVDYVCVVEFQRRGVIHYHYLIVAKPSAWLTYPDESIFRWGYTHLKELKTTKKALRYLTAYVEKMSQLDFQTYSRWKQKFGRFRLYEFGRPRFSKPDVLRFMEKGWGRYLYFRLLRHFRGWFFDGKGLEVIKTYKGVEIPLPSYFAILSSYRQMEYLNQYKENQFEFVQVYVFPSWLELRSPRWVSLTFAGFFGSLVWCGSDGKNLFRYELPLDFRRIEVLEKFINEVYRQVDIWSYVSQVFSGNRSPPSPKLPDYCLDW